VSGKRSTQPLQPADEPDAHAPLIELARAVDAVAGGRVLVFGSPPPHGRDLDILVREPQEHAIATRLETEGLLRRGVQWVAFRACTAVGVDLVPAADWRLPPTELASLFEEGEVVPGYDHLVAPAPHHALLIAARRVARAGEYGDRLRERVGETLRAAPSAWEQAARRAPAWQAVKALAFLRALHASGSQPDRAARARSVLTRVRGLRQPRLRTAARALRRLARRPAIVALSGLDGAGKSFQAERLAAALERLDRRAMVVWPPAANVLFQANPAVKQRLFAVLRMLGRSDGRKRTAPPPSAPSLSAPSPSVASPSAASLPALPSPAAPVPAAPAPAFEEPPLEPLPRQRAPVAHALGLIVALAQAWAFRRGVARAGRRVDVVIYDRYALDSIVYLRHRWGQGRAFPLQSALIRRLARLPDRAFLLDVEPAVAYARKQDFPLENLRERAALYRELYPRLGCARLDGERPATELCAEIARSVWECLG
jgi:thymidylate kinase